MSSYLFCSNGKVGVCGICHTPVNANSKLIRCGFCRALFTTPIKNKECIQI